MSVEASLGAATQLRISVRQAGVVGMPGVRIRADRDRGPNAFELTVEDRREAEDEVYESRGIRFYVDPETVSRLGSVILDLDGLDLVLRPRRDDPD